jgi:DNA-binding transcriptional regulator LsrR (DeoR family)
MPMVVEILGSASAPTRLQITMKVLHLRDLGMTRRAIAEALGVSEKTIARAISDARGGLPRDRAS